MCELSLALTAVSTLVGAAGQYMRHQSESKAQAAAAEYNAQIAAQEQATQQQLAQNEIAKGEADRSRRLRAGARQQGEMRSLMGASGFEMDSGSALSLLGESAEEIQYDANIVGQNAAMAAWGHQVGATRAANDQAWQQYQKQQAGSGKGAGLGGTLLGGLGEGLVKYNQSKAYSPNKSLMG